ncbi:hypothetical protein HU200_059048 [Digitaria exilis]|nr:hypothetical protein HU200_059048 [Digitaria exilis]
MHAEKL